MQVLDYQLYGHEVNIKSQFLEQKKQMSSTNHQIYYARILKIGVIESAIESML